MPKKYVSQIKKFGSSVRERRENAQLTQAELAKQCEVDIRTVRRIEKGEFAIGLEIVLSLAKVLKLQVLVRRTLTKYGYPPDLQQKAIDTILKQAELIADKYTRD